MPSRPIGVFESCMFMEVLPLSLSKGRASRQIDQS
jgi:hypothetical protein